MDWRWGGWGGVGQRIKASRYKINKFWGSNIQHDDYNEQYCITFLKVVKRVDLKCYHTYTQKS